MKKVKTSYLSEFLLVCSVCVILIVLVLPICIIQIAVKGNRIEYLEHETEYKPIQERTTLTLDDMDKNYLFYIAQYKGGTTEDRAYTILVTLNRQLALGYDIPTLVQLELGKIEVPDKLVIEYETMEAMHIIQKENFDNSAGSLKYIK